MPAKKRTTNQYDSVPIRVFASTENFRTYDSRDESQVVDIIRKQVLPREKAEYHSVNVKIKRKEDGSPQYMVAYLLRKDTYTADVVRINVNKNFQVRSYEDDYIDIEDDEETKEDEEEGERYETIDFIVATPVPEITTAKAAAEAIHLLATNVGLNSKLLLGVDATVANYKHYLKSGLRGFVNIGHGNPSCIVLYDGSLTASWFQSVTGLAISPAVVYFNSCQVFNNPLQPAVMHAGTRTFIGGIVNLGIGPSEQVCMCFWTKILMQNIAMGVALKDCEKAKYPTQGAHGISGDLGLFNFITSVIDKYKVVVYGKDSTGGNLAAYIHCFQSTMNVMSCEFYQDGSILPENRYKGGRVGLVYPWSKFSAILDMLRNEKPLYYGFIMSTKVGYIASQEEPVGEGSDKS
jgi:hypothetical protein